MELSVPLEWSRLQMILPLALIALSPVRQKGSRLRFQQLLDPWTFFAWIVMTTLE